MLTHETIDRIEAVLLDEPLDELSRADIERLKTAAHIGVNVLNKWVDDPKFKAVMAEFFPEGNAVGPG